MISIKNVKFSYDDSENSGLDELSLHIPKGQCVLLAGVSGCGKTTLLRLINGLIPRFYSGELSGQVEIDGQAMNGYDTDDLSQKAGCVFQNPRSQFFNVDTTSEIAFGCENLGFTRKEIHRRVDETVKALGITHLLDKSIFSLSGGEKQMIAIASIYAMGVDIFLMDEPSSNLDAVATQQLRKMIERLKAEGKTIVIAEHRLHYLKNVVDRVLHLKEGQVANDWTSTEFQALGTAELGANGLRSLSFHHLINEEPNKVDSADTQLQIEDLWVSYEPKQYVVKEVSHVFHQGEIVGLVGHNGQGKSTLARCLCGMVKEKRGTVSYDNTLMPHKKRIGNIYLVMQDATSQLFSDSVLGELELSCQARKEDSPYTNDEILDMFSLSHLHDRHPISLSGGEKQRLAIAAGMAQNADVIILDEPTSGLDHQNMKRVKEVMKVLRQNGKMVLVITHDFEFLLNTCDRVLIIEDGTVRTDYHLDEAHFSQINKFFLID